MNKTKIAANILFSSKRNFECGQEKLIKLHKLRVQTRIGKLTWTISYNFYLRIRRSILVQTHAFGFIRLIYSFPNLSNSQLSYFLITRDDLSQLPFLTMFIKESLRFHPPVPEIARTLVKDVTLPNGLLLPKGT